MCRKIRCDGESWKILETKQGLTRRLYGARSEGLQQITEAKGSHGPVWLSPSSASASSHLLSSTSSPPPRSCYSGERSVWRGGFGSASGQQRWRNYVIHVASPKEQFVVGLLNIVGVCWRHILLGGFVVGHYPSFALVGVIATCVVPACASVFSSLWIA